MINPTQFGSGWVRLSRVRFGVERAMLVLVFQHNSLLKLMSPTPQFLNFINKYKRHNSLCMQVFENLIDEEQSKIWQLRCNKFKLDIRLRQRNPRGHPSITQLTPPPWDSPQVVTRKQFPTVFPTAFISVKIYEFVIIGWYSFGW